MSARIVRDNTAAILAKLERIAGRELNKAAFDIEANAKVSIQNGTKSGKVYKLKKTHGRYGQKLKRARKIVHRASAPGEAPANLFGGLVNGIITVSPLGSKLRRRVISTAAYSRRLEKGMNRPFLEPAFHKVAPVFQELVRRRFRRYTHGA